MKSGGITGGDAITSPAQPLTRPTGPESPIESLFPPAVLAHLMGAYDYLTEEYPLHETPAHDRFEIAVRHLHREVSGNMPRYFARFRLGERFADLLAHGQRVPEGSPAYYLETIDDIRDRIDRGIIFPDYTPELGEKLERYLDAAVADFSAHQLGGRSHRHGDPVPFLRGPVAIAERLARVSEPDLAIRVLARVASGISAYMTARPDRPLLSEFREKALTLREEALRLAERIGDAEHAKAIATDLVVTAAVVLAVAKQRDNHLLEGRALSAKLKGLLALAKLGSRLVPDPYEGPGYTGGDDKLWGDVHGALIDLREFLKGHPVLAGDYAALLAGGYAVCARREALMEHWSSAADVYELYAEWRGHYPPDLSETLVDVAWGLFHAFEARARLNVAIQTTEAFDRVMGALGNAGKVIDRGTFDDGVDLEEESHRQFHALRRDYLAAYLPIRAGQIGFPPPFGRQEIDSFIKTLVRRMTEAERIFGVLENLIRFCLLDVKRRGTELTADYEIARKLGLWLQRGIELISEERGLFGVEFRDLLNSLRERHLELDREIGLHGGIEKIAAKHARGVQRTAGYCSGDGGASAPVGRALSFAGPSILGAPMGGAIFVGLPPPMLPALAPLGRL